MYRPYKILRVSKNYFVLKPILHLIISLIKLHLILLIKVESNWYPLNVTIQTFLLYSMVS